MSEFDNLYVGKTNSLGDSTQTLVVNDKLSAQKIGLFYSYIAKPFASLTTTLGLRADYFSFDKRMHISPRMSFSLKVGDITTINGSTGFFYQNLPMLFLAQNNSIRNLSTPKAVHYIVGLNRLVTETSKLTVELYQKSYEHFPMDIAQPAIFLMDNTNFQFNLGKLVDAGKAYSRGVEITLQKKLASDFYGLASASIFRTRYKGLDGTWRNRSFDNRFMCSFEGGYKPNNTWEFSARWIYAGGVPFTPLNLELSKNFHREVLDETRINQSRYPDYHSMNIRFDKRFHFQNSNLIFYLSVWNVYNRKNIATFYWNDKEQKQDKIYQWLVLPIFGVEYEL